MRHQTLTRPLLVAEGTQGGREGGAFHENSRLPEHSCSEVEDIKRVYAYLHAYSCVCTGVCEYVYVYFRVK